MKRADTQDVRERPAYSVGEAAHYLRIPAKTLADWAFGRDYPTATGTRRWAPLFEPANKPNRKLSFVNLVEAHVVAAIRRGHGIKIPKVRTALDFVKSRLGVARPLYGAEFETDGADLFVQKYGELINASRSGQLAMKEVIQSHLRRIGRDTHKIPIRLYPAKPNSDEPSRFVAIDPRIAFGRPALIDIGAPIAVLADRFHGGDSIALLAGDYGVDHDAVEEALRQAELLRAA